MNVVAKLVYSENKAFRDPTWEDVRSLITSLDGGRHTDVFIGEPDEYEYMAISGGNDERYVVSVQDGKEVYYVLLNSARGTEDVRVNLGGLEDYYPANESHDLNSVLQVAKTYYKTGTIDPGFPWRTVGQKPKSA